MAGVTRIHLHPRRPTDERRREALLWVAVTAAVVVMAAWLLAACGAASSRSRSPESAPSRSSGPPRTSGYPRWLLTRAALSRLAGDPAASQALRDSPVSEILRPGQQLLAGLTAEPVVIFNSAASLANAVRGGQLPAGTHAVMYDPEAWQFTPVIEQRDPVQAARQAAAVAHARGLELIVAPALNLTTVLAPGNPQSRWRRFLELNLAGRLAKIADAIELQAQSLERDTTIYARFVRAASSQARIANPRIDVLAGLSTNPPGMPVDSENLTSAIHATRPIVTGYWLNIPGRGRCPTCNTPRLDIGIQTLRAVH